jgi:phytol kinase
MDLITDWTLTFFINNFPSWNSILIGCPFGIMWSYLCLYFAGYLKKRRGWKIGYTRKTFHFLIFTSVVIIQMVWDTSTVCLFGGTCTLVIFYAVRKGAGNLLYEAIARENDEPHRTYYIVIPYFATLIGGLASNILFGHIAVVGYLVAGLGDAAGEPVG